MWRRENHGHDLPLKSLRLADILLPPAASHLRALDAPGGVILSRYTPHDDCETDLEKPPNND
jgi:hypothetical protein